MRARVTTIQLPVEELTDEIFAFRRRILQSAQAMDGFRGALDLVDRDSGKSVAITLWESEEAMRASERAAPPAAIPPVAGPIPAVEMFDVVFRAPLIS